MVYLRGVTIVFKEQVIPIVIMKRQMSLFGDNMLGVVTISISLLTWRL